MEFIHGRPLLADVFRTTRYTLNNENDYLFRVGLIVLIRGAPTPDFPQLVASTLIAEHGGHQTDYVVTQATITPYIITCPSTRIRDRIVRRRIYSVPQTQIQFTVHEWRPRFGMSYNPPTHQVWVKIVGLPLQAWTQPEVTAILQNFGHPIDILPFGEAAGHYTDITALVNTKHPSNIPLAYTYRESDYSAQVDILILSWRQWENSYFPPPNNPIPQQPPPAHPQQQNDPTVSVTHSSSSSNNAPSEPTIDYSSWSPRSYSLDGNLGKLGSKSKSAKNATGGCPGIASSLLAPELHTTLLKLLKLHTSDSDSPLLAKRRYTLTFSRPQLTAQPSTFSRHPANPEVNRAQVITIALETTHRRIQLRCVSSDQNTCTALTPALPDFGTAAANQRTNLDTQRIIFEKPVSPIEAPNPIVIKTGSQILTLLLQSGTFRGISSEMVIDTGKIEIDGLLSLLYRAKKEPIPYLLTRATGMDGSGREDRENRRPTREKEIWNPALTIGPFNPNQRPNLQTTEAISRPIRNFQFYCMKAAADAPNPPQMSSPLDIPRPQASLHSLNGSLLLTRSTLLDPNPNQTKDIERTVLMPDQTENLSNSQLSRLHNKKKKKITRTMTPTRRSQRLQAKRPTDGTNFKASNKNKARVTKLPFSLHALQIPLQADTAISILQQSGLHIDQTIRQMIFEAAGESLHSTDMEDPRPTTPLHDAIPPRMLPGEELLL